MKISNLICVALIALCFQSRGLAQDKCEDLFFQKKISRIDSFFQNPNLDDPIFRRPRVQKMMLSLYEQLKKNDYGKLSLTPEVGEVGINLTGGFVVDQSEIRFKLPILIIEERPLPMQKLRFKKLSYGERPEQLSPLFPEFVFAFLGSVQMYAHEHPEVKKMILKASELQNETLKTSLERIGFEVDPSELNQMVLIQELNTTTISH